MLHYRAEIDGLRAVAVLPVMFFHAGFPAFGGGFVGVDVFLVISGYLITSIIVGELASGQFSLARFYERRARRILPALFLVMAVSLPFAWSRLLPQDLKSFSQSLVAVPLFASNFLFWLTSDYFESAADLKPLLHTWSLAVEEQYYIFFPLMLLLGWRMGKRSVAALVGVLALLSLAAAQYAALKYPAFGFYLLPTRAWELFVGALVALYYTDHNIRRHGYWVAQLCSLLGVGLIGYAVATYSEQTPFPGVHALAPVLGTALVIVFATQKTLVGRLLSVKPVVWVGLISYSAYLWHQPMFAFARQRSLSEPNPLMMGALTLLVLPLAYLSWRFVERPFRNRHRISRRQVAAFGLGCSVLFIAIGLVGHRTDGFWDEWRANHPDKARSLELLARARQNSAVMHAAKRPDDKACIFSVEDLTPEVAQRIDACRARHGKGVAVLGDSHATNLFNSLQLANRGRVPFLIGLTKNSCHLPAELPECPYAGFLRYLQDHPGSFRAVVFEKAGWLMLRSPRGDVLPTRLQRIGLASEFAGFQPRTDVLQGVAAYLQQVGQWAPVVWFGPRVEPQFSDDAIVELGCQHPFQLRKGQVETYRKLDDATRRAAASAANVTYVSQIEAYHPDFPRDFLNCQAIYWTDGNHYSEAGEAEFGRRFDTLGFVLQRY